MLGIWNSKNIDGNLESIYSFALREMMHLTAQAGGGGEVKGGELCLKTLLLPHRNLNN